MNTDKEDLKEDEELLDDIKGHIKEPHGGS
jgi:predicted small metal-binding protein